MESFSDVASLIDGPWSTSSNSLILSHWVGSDNQNMFPAMRPNGVARPVPRQPHVVILGGAYAGLSTALNLLRFCDGKLIRSGEDGGRRGEDSFRGSGRVSRGGRGGFPASMLMRSPLRCMPQITLLDSRDGFCKQFRIAFWVVFPIGRYRRLIC